MTKLPNPNPDFRIDCEGEYIKRLGHRVVLKANNNEIWPWKGDDGFIYRSNGQYLGWQEEHPNDIIAKAPTAAGEGLPSPIVPGYYRQRDGEKVYVAAIIPDGLSGSTPVLGVANEDARFWTLEGKYYPDLEAENDWDLISPWREPVVVDAFINVFADGDVMCWHDRNRADIQAGKERLACVHLRITDGIRVEITPENGDE